MSVITEIDTSNTSIAYDIVEGSPWFAGMHFPLPPIGSLWVNTVEVHYLWESPREGWDPGDFVLIVKSSLKYPKETISVEQLQHKNLSGIKFRLQFLTMKTEKMNELMLDAKIWYDHFEKMMQNEE